MNESLKYRWSPKRGITTYELAVVLPLVTRLYAMPVDDYKELNERIKNLPGHLKKHFTTTEQ